MGDDPTSSANICASPINVGAHAWKCHACGNRPPLLPNASLLVLRNVAALQDSQQGDVDASDPTRNRFYLVVVQYAARLSAQKISAAVMRLKPGGERLSRARCNLQVASEEVRV